VASLRGGKVASKQVGRWVGFKMPLTPVAANFQWNSGSRWTKHGWAASIRSAGD